MTSGTSATVDPVAPQAGPQAELYSCPADEVAFGGARGGGKSYALLIDWLRHVSQYGGKARGILFRRTMPELEDIIDKARETLPLSGFTFKAQSKTWEHTTGATLKLRYLERDADADRYQGHAYNWLGIDEAGTWPSPMGLDRIRATLRDASGVRPRMVITCNPGGPGHDWIKARYIDDCPPRRIRVDDNGWSWCFIPARFEDNKILRESDPSYIDRATEHLPEYLRRAWRDGDWDISSEAGMFFRRDEFQFIDSAPKLEKIVRCWDRAATEPSDTAPDPDWSAGVKMGKDQEGNVYVLDVIRVRRRAAKIRELIYSTAKTDGAGCRIRLFQDPGQAGKGEAEDMKRLLARYSVQVRPETGAKHTRWMPYSSAVQNKIVWLVRGKWNDEYINELTQLTDVESDYAHDDQADASAGAYNDIMSGTGKMSAAGYGLGDMGL